MQLGFLLKPKSYFSKNPLDVISNFLHFLVVRPTNRQEYRELSIKKKPLIKRTSSCASANQLILKQ